MAEVSDLELAVSTFLPEVWQSERTRHFLLTRDIAMRLLEAMLRKLVCITVDEGSYENGAPARCHLEQPLSKLLADGEDAELTVAIVRAAATLVRKEKGE